MEHAHCEHCEHHHGHHEHDHGHHEHHEHDHGHHHHGHHHEHHHDGEGVKGKILKIVIAALLLAVCVFIEHKFKLDTWQLLLIYLIPYLIVGFDTLKEAAEGLSRGEALDENFLMSIATLGALAIGFLPGAETQFPEAVFVMLFFQVGELFEGIAEGRSRRSIEHLTGIRPDTANVERDGLVSTVGPETVGLGEIIVVRPGERIPLDGEVLEGASALDTVALTGESLPRDVAAGDEVFSGCVNLSGVLRVKVNKSFGESTASKIISLVEEAADGKSRSERFITRFARVYTPIVVGLAILVAFIPPLFSASYAAAFPVWLYRALMFLVVSCPCALVISVPLAFFGGLGAASRKGVLVKGSAFLEALSRMDTVVFDKTGTLTEGVFEVTAVHPEELDERELLHLAAHVERHSVHPIAQSLRNAYPDEADECEVGSMTEYAGEGVTALVNGKVVAVGNGRLMDRLGATWHPCHKTGTIVHVAIDGEYAGHIVISDRVKDHSAEALSALKECGVRRTVMLTGDDAKVASEIAGEVKVDEFHASLLPQDKVSRIEGLLGEGLVAFVGDGINDAPVLARADVGIAMGALGSDAAIDAADVVLMDDNLLKISDAVRISRKTMRIARENIIFAIGVKILVLLLAAAGLASMWMAVFADVGVTVLAVLNAMRALKSR